MVPSSYFQGRATGEIRSAQFPFPLCNLSTCRYAYPNGALEAFFGRRHVWCRMLVDFELIKSAQKGDSAAFNEIVTVYRKRSLGTITRSIVRTKDVEDVAQEVFLRFYFSLDQLRTSEVFEPWLYRLTVNAAYDYRSEERRVGKECR